MKSCIDQPRLAEGDAAAAKPQPLARPEGEKRFQAALDADWRFRLYLLASFVVAAVAGIGFGRLALLAKPVHTLLWGSGVFGLAIRCIGPNNPRSRFARVLIGIIRFITLPGGIAYAYLVWCRPAGWSMLGVVLVVMAIMALNVLSARRRRFGAIVAAVVAVHLGALPPDANLLGNWLPMQLVAATLEFLLLMLAGMHFVNASLARLPTATYRLAPLCIVPRLNRAWDHPVKINVV